MKNNEQKNKDNEQDIRRSQTADTTEDAPRRVASIERHARTRACVPRKMRADSIINRLSPEQRDKVEGWLFEEGASYIEVRDRVKRLWNVVCSASSVGRFYRTKVRCRTLEELDETKETTRALERSSVEPERVQKAALKVVSKRFLDLAMDNGDVKELTALGRLLAEARWQDYRDGRLQLMREKFEYNAVAAAMAELPHAQKMTIEDLERKDTRMEEMRHRLFGTRLPDDANSCVSNRDDSDKRG